MAVLDTNILVDMMRKRPGPTASASRRAVRALLERGEPLATTRFNVAEMFVGAAMSANPEQEAGRIDEAIRLLLILDFDHDAARVYGTIEASLRRAGRPVGDMDTLIASVAIRHGQSIVTRNPRHFADIPGLSIHPV